MLAPAWLPENPPTILTHRALTVMTAKDRILCIDDDQDQVDLLGVTLTRLGYAVVTTTSPLHALELVTNEAFDVIVTDLGMNEMSGLDLCGRILDLRPQTPVVVLTGQGDMESAIGALRVGAYDYLSKPIDAKFLSISMSRALQHTHLRAELQKLKLATRAPGKAYDLIGDSPAMARLTDMLKRVGASEASVLIQGETGTGKELVARAVHAASPRRDGPFVALNCAAVPDSLLESELFGHAQGAFTDAKNARQGLFVQSSGGTLFLDEIGEMQLDMQAKLLRALQERKVRPVGSNAEVAFDARIVTASHRNIEAAVDDGRFRQDLYYRINVVRLDVPALRDRGNDVLQLAVYFLHSALERSGKGAVQLSAQAAERLTMYEWPGNVRELENCIERAVALCRFDHITVEDLPEAIRAYNAGQFRLATDTVEDIISLDELERRYIMRTLKLLDGNKARVAQLLGLDRRTLYRKLDRYDGTKTAASEAPAEGDPDGSADGAAAAPAEGEVEGPREASTEAVSEPAK